MSAPYKPWEPRPPAVHEADSGMICRECVLMIANGETEHDMHADELAAIVEGTAGWTLQETENDGDHSVYPCATCDERLHGDRYGAVRLVPALPPYAFPGGYPIAYLKDGHTALCAKCASLEGMTVHDGRSTEGSSGIDCEECEETIVERTDTHECEHCDSWVNPDECLTVGKNGYCHECTSCGESIEVAS